MRRRSRLVAAALPLLMLLTLLLTTCGGSAGTQLADAGAHLQSVRGVAASVYAQGLPNASAIAFDADGRLWVATAAYADAGTDAVYFVDTVGSTPERVIADAHTPLGLLWYDDALYVAAAGGVEAYSGFSGTSFAEHHTVVDLPDGVGEVNGLAMSTDGRISLGVSAPCDACTPDSTYSAAVLSFLPDGSDLRVDAGGIRAPVGLAYFPGTTELFVTMNQRDDLGDATPGDWLSIVSPGQEWGFPGCYGQATEDCKSKPGPVAALDPHAAVSGVAIVTGDLGPSVGTAALVAEWAKGVVLLVPLQADGSAAAGAPRTFLTGIKSPVAIALRSDGSVFVADWATGTVYRVTATSQTALTAP